MFITINIKSLEHFKLVIKRVDKMNSEKSNAE